MDVEGAEWEALINLDEKTLNQFQQMVFEFHDMYDPHRYSMICRVLEKLNKTHQCVHVHGTTTVQENVQTNSLYLTLWKFYMPEKKVTNFYQASTSTLENSICHAIHMRMI